MKALVMDTGRYTPELNKVKTDILEGAKIEVVSCAGNAPEEVIECGRDCQAFLTAIGTFDAPLFDELPECRIVARFGIGFDTVDLAAATARGIVVSNVPDAIIDEVADHAMALILAVWRRIPKADTVARSGWDRSSLHPIHRIRGLTLGIVGLGHIGKALASRAMPFGFRVIAFDPYVTGGQGVDPSCERVTFSELLARSDVVSVHTPLTDETRDLFDAEAFERMKRTAIFVNTARGPIQDQRALYKALTAGEIAGAGLDVLEAEPPAPTDPLLDLESVVVTPHMAGYSEEGVQEILEKAAWNAVAVLKGFYPPYVVNSEVVPKPPLRPYPGNNRALLA